MTNDQSKAAPEGDMLDTAHLDRQTFGDEELAREVLNLFILQAAAMVDIIASDAPLPQRRDAAHTLKGASRGIGAFAVATCAEEVEAAIGRRPSETLPDAIARLRRIVDETCAAIRTLFPAQPAQSGHDVARKSA
jgi:HPt (histidine-containing phosphotransfer) domain-containing protein